MAPDRMPIRESSLVMLRVSRRGRGKLSVLSKHATGWKQHPMGACRLRLDQTSLGVGGDASKHQPHPLLPRDRECFQS